MQFSENWLRSYVNTSLDSDALNHVMIMAGLDVDDSHPLGASFSHVVVGEIVAIKNILMQIDFKYAMSILVIRHYKLCVVHLMRDKALKWHVP